jgi:SagB-type dehydrogenase family enzyme
MQAWDYHNQTKHSPESIRRNPHFLDWANRPLLFKIYPDLQPIPLPQDLPQSGVAALSAIASPGIPERNAAPTLAEIASLLFFAAGITRRRGDILFRAAACTGALYETELYLVCGPLDGLDAGVYHFNPGDFSLRRLRQGDLRGIDPAMAHAPATLIATGTYWRNAWKYRARTYRHFGWDNGTITANLLAIAAAQGLPATLHCGFIDDDINRLLGLDTYREVALTLFTIGHTADAAPAPAAIPELRLDTVPLSDHEVDYPAMRAVHAASSFTWLEVVAGGAGGFARRAQDDAGLPADTIEQVILRRGSSRRFTQAPIAATDLSTILDRATRGIAADFPPMNDIYLIVNAVDGLQPGSYFYDAAARRLELLESGGFRECAAHLALDQQLAGDAAAAVFFLADLKHWLERLGDRAYRAAHLEAGILGGKMYLAAYALRLGATGLTFYDDEVVQFFSPHAAGKSAIFMTALGHPAKRTLR